MNGSSQSPERRWIISVAKNIQVIAVKEKRNFGWRLYEFFR